jgi:hypothetical protein
LYRQKCVKNCGFCAKNRQNCNEYDNQMAEVIQQSRYHFGDNRRYMVMIHVFMTFYRLDLTSPKNKIFRGESKTINVNANVTG